MSTDKKWCAPQEPLIGSGVLKSVCLKLDTSSKIALFLRSHPRASTCCSLTIRKLDEDLSPHHRLERSSKRIQDFLKP